MNSEFAILPTLPYRYLQRLKLILIAILTVASCVLFANPVAAQTLTQYSNATTGAITDVNCGTAAQITRTFTVPTSAIIGDVDLGVLLTHTFRSDLRITLRSPGGITVNVMTNTAGSGDNLNDRFDDEAAANISTHNATVTDPVTPAPPPYSHSFQPTSPLSAFDGQNAAGTWTMVICDSAAADTGNFLRADLFITSTSLTVTKISSVVSDGVSATNPKAIPGSIVRYCVLITNNGGATQTNVISTDPLPADVTLVVGSLLSGTSCAGAATAEDADAAGADESDPFGISVSGTTVSGSAPSLAAGTSFAMVFNITIN